MTMCILLLGNNLKYIPLSVPFSTPPYVGNKIFFPQLTLAAGRLNPVVCISGYLKNTHTVYILEVPWYT